MSEELTEAELEVLTAPTQTVGGNATVVKAEKPDILKDYVEPPDGAKAKNFGCTCGEKLIYNKKDARWKCAKFYTDEQTKTCQVFDPTIEDEDSRGNKLGYLKNVFTW